MSAVTSILFCGTGGQGILTAAEVCGWAAVLEGYHVKKSEVHGMAQRGGSVESHVRFGKVVYSPLIPEGKADILAPFHPDEEKRLKSFLKKDGIDLLPELDKAIKIKDKRFINTFMLGVISTKLDIKQPNWHKALEIVYKSKRLKENIEYFTIGRGAK